MKWSQTFIPTLRNVPKDAEAISHQLALRAGLVRQLSSGVYSYLPLGLRALQKITQIVREEMLAAGASEVLLPALHPAEIWKKSGRYDSLGQDKIAFENRAGHEFVLGPTHEEVITDLVGTNIKSFRDLPQMLFQIQTKFRDEARPRFGVIRTKEFIMKDAYSFDTDEKALDESYQKMEKAYHKIFERIGLPIRVVEADTGVMGGSRSQEFMFQTPYGEDKVAISKQGYIASLDIAVRKNPALTAPTSSSKKYESFDTPNLRTIEEISKKFKLEPSKMVKTIIFIADEKPIAGIVTGDSDINEGKLRKLVGATNLRPAAAHEIREATGAPVGFAGPVNLKIPVYADWDVEGITDFVVGANEKDKHFKNIVMGRDFKPTATGDIRYVKEGDEAEDGSGELELVVTMEVGHIFKLGTRYSKALDAKYLDDQGKEQDVIMGCYGIGVTRVFAAAIEAHHDKDGIQWPEAIAPFKAHLITLNPTVPAVKRAGDNLYQVLQNEGIEVLYDDRDERAGVKFKDADLLGIPYQIVIGERNLKEGKVEVKYRTANLNDVTPISELGKVFGIDTGEDDL